MLLGSINCQIFYPQQDNTEIDIGHFLFLCDELVLATFESTVFSNTIQLHN